MNHCVLSVLMENRSGALSRLVGLFSQRGYNIKSLCVAPTADPGVSRLTLATSGEDRALEQIKKHLNKLIDVIKLHDLTESPSLDRELMLVKLHPAPRRRAEVSELCQNFSAQVVDVGQDGYYTVQLVGAVDRLDAFIGLLREDEVVEIVRSGICALSRGRRALEL